MTKSIVKIICFGTILIFILKYVNDVFSFKYGDGIYSLTKFYELEEDTVDVLFLGSSHAFENVNTGTLWDEYGMSSYVLAGSLQPMWNTYFYLKEALKTQTPELIVLEAFTTKLRVDYSEDSRIIKNTYGMKWSKDKVEAIKVSAPEERWGDFFLDYAQYHTRYRELGKHDFYENQGNLLFNNWKGFGCNMATVSYDRPDVSEVFERRDMTEKTEEYYRKTIELALENEIPILVVLSPYAGIDEEDQQLFNTVEDITEEYGVEFINYNFLYDELGLDFSTDIADQDHLNYKGSQKFTFVLGKDITEKYNVSDRRGQEGYESWEADADYIAAIINNQKMLESNSVDELMNTTKNGDYAFWVSVDGECTTSDENIKNILEIFGIYEEQANGVWYLENLNNIVYKITGEEEKHYYKLDANDVLISRIFEEKTQSYSNSVIINNSKYKKTEDGVNIIVYSNITQSVVGVWGIDMDNDYSFIK